MTRSRSRVAPGAAVGAVAALLLTACSGNSGGGDDAGDGGPVNLKIAFWGDFGLDELKGKYEAANPNVKIVLNSGEYNAQHEDLQKKLIAGSGAADIAAIDEGFIVQFRGQQDKFVNLLDKGAGKFSDKYLAWKWKQTLSPDGKYQIGLGTDVGGLAMCYRTDLFKAAGLPTERDTGLRAVADLGRLHRGRPGRTWPRPARSSSTPPPTSSTRSWASSRSASSTSRRQLKMDGGPKAAFDLTHKAIEAGLSANLAAFSPEWNAGFVKGNFAVLACPAWMHGPHQEHRAATPRASGTSRPSPAAAATGAARS